MRLTYPAKAGGGVEEFEVKHIDLYFFYDLDIVILAIEILTFDISFQRAHETLYRLGRAYPTFWEGEDGHGGHCFAKVEWLGADGKVLSTSDYERREKYLSYVCRYHAPCISSHWEFLLHPLVLHHSDEQGPIRYRLLEYHRMPLAGYFAMENPRDLTRADFIRLAFVTRARQAERAAVLRAPPAQLRLPLLPRPLLARARRRTARHATHVHRRGIHDGRRRG